MRRFRWPAAVGKTAASPPAMSATPGAANGSEMAL
jgi:hypothetical protein